MIGIFLLVTSPASETLRPQTAGTARSAAGQGFGPRGEEPAERQYWQLRGSAVPEEQRRSDVAWVYSSGANTQATAA